jgi:hypothetical protein
MRGNLRNALRSQIQRLSDTLQIERCFESACLSAGIAPLIPLSISPAPSFTFHRFPLLSPPATRSDKTLFSVHGGDDMYRICKRVWKPPSVNPIFGSITYHWRVSLSQSKVFLSSCNHIHITADRCPWESKFLTRLSIHARTDPTFAAVVKISFPLSTFVFPFPGRLKTAHPGARSKRTL